MCGLIIERFKITMKALVKMYCKSREIFGQAAGIAAVALVLLIVAQPRLARAADDAPLGSHVVVVRTSPELEGRFKELERLFQAQGTDAVADSIQDELGHPDSAEMWKAFVQSGNTKVIDVKVHPNEAAAVNWMNSRFKQMGLENLEMRALADSSLADSTALPEDQIRGRKWLRYLAGPGVALAGAYLALPEGANIQSTADYLYLIIPGAAVGVTTVALELQFAWPWLNDVFWKKAWRFGGAIGGRVTNTVVNFLYGMALYGAGVGGANLPLIWGGEAVPFQTMGFAAAVTAAVVGGIRFHIAMGQYQTDISTEETRGTINGSGRYGRETTGVVVNNGARVYDWVAPGEWGAWAQSGFFLVKTVPQLLKTHVAHRMQDASIREKIKAPGVTREATGWRASVNKAVVTCGELLKNIAVFNLPKQRKTED
jgi:hypothetical protein